MIAHPSPATQPVRTRRDFLTLTAAGMALIGLGGAAWVLGDSLNPAGDMPRYRWSDIAGMKVGERRIIKWHGRPVIVHRRTPEQIRWAREMERSGLYPEPEWKRTQDPTWFVALGICTFRGCELLDWVDSANSSSSSAWFCPCDGFRYDLSGRVTAGPAPENMYLPPYELAGPDGLRLG